MVQNDPLRLSSDTALNGLNHTKCRLFKHLSDLRSVQDGSQRGTSVSVVALENKEKKKKAVLGASNIKGSTDTWPIRNAISQFKIV